VNILVNKLLAGCPCLFLYPSIWSDCECRPRAMGRRNGLALVLAIL